jgi:NADH:ubiquinone oxidoreductase subunit E
VSFHPRIEYATFHRSERKLAEEGEPFAYTPERQAIFDELVTHYPPEQRKSAILYALFLVQEQQGYVSGAGMRHVAQQIGCTPAEVEDVVSYYTMFYTTEELSARLGITPGQTTADGMFTLIEVECLGACDRAPVVMVNNDHWHERLAPEQVPQLLEALRARGIESLTGCHLEVEKK